MRSPPAACLTGLAPSQAPPVSAPETLQIARAAGIRHFHPLRPPRTDKALEQPGERAQCLSTLEPMRPRPGMGIPYRPRRSGRRMVVMGERGSGQVACGEVGSFTGGYPLRVARQRTNSLGTGSTSVDAGQNTRADNARKGFLGAAWPNVARLSAASGNRPETPRTTPRNPHCAPSPGEKRQPRYCGVSGAGNNFRVDLRPIQYVV